MRVLRRCLSTPALLLVMAASFALLCSCQRKPEASSNHPAQPADKTEFTSSQPKKHTSRSKPASRRASEKKETADAGTTQEEKTPAFEDQPQQSTEGVATWYEVPPGSLPERRAEGAWTAAHDTLPIGSYVRVTDKKTGRDVVVRITDRGVRNKAAIDLCKEAAQFIGLVARGRTQVRIDVLKPRDSIVAKVAKDLPVAAAPAMPKDGAKPPAPSP